MAAIQGLYRIVQEQEVHIEALEAENATLRGRLDSLEARMAVLEQQSGAPVACPAGQSALGLLVSGLLMGLVVVGRNRVLRRSPGGG